MNVTAFLKIALTALSRNRMRAFLTVLGILIGVGAVIAMMGIGQGAKGKVQEQFTNMGTNMLVIMPGTVTQGGIRVYGAVTKFYPADMEAIKKNCPDVAYAAPMVFSVQTVTAENQNWSTSITGVSPDSFNIRNWPVSSGRLIRQDEVNTGSMVCILGQTVVNNLFGAVNPVGRIVRVKHVPFSVVGVASVKGNNAFGQDQDDVVMVPYTTEMRRITGTIYLHGILASARSTDAISNAVDEISRLLRQRHHLAPWQQDDFMIRSLNEFVQAREAATNVIVLLLGSVAGISLLVGGIGIMNIMLVSVTERTREIGIRMAVGATENDIRMQFLIEALVLSFAGGTLGICLGITAALILSKLAHWAVIISPGSILLAFFFSAAIGVFFGYYPAKKAGQLDPIEALRYQ